MRIADVIAEWLASRGITHAFTIIGGGNVVLLDALQKARKIAIVCCHHEQAAAMASGYFNRIRNTLGSVVLCTTGAGSTNAITGVMAAHMDSTPLLVLSGNEHSKHFDNYASLRLRINGVQGYPSTLVAAPFCSHVHQVMPWDSVEVCLERGWREALGMNASPRRGAVWLDFPKDVQQHGT